MAYIYYNQRNYANVPYPGSNRPDATVKSGGCGVCSALMALENNTDFRMSISEMAQYSIRNNGRDNNGTNLVILLAAIKRDYAGFDYRFTDSKEELVAHLRNGGGAIANVGGDRNGYNGIFCTTGHFVYVAGMNGDGVTVLDPDQYNGKYDGWRSAHVTVNGNELYCDPIRLDQDCSNRSPRYYLVAGIKNAPQEPPQQPAQPPQDTLYHVGDEVTVSTYYASSTEPDSAKAVVPSHWVTATITGISPVPGARNPYLLNGGNIGWCNDGDIRGRGEVHHTRMGTVATNNLSLNFRKSPDGEIMGSIPKGAQVEIVGESGGWYQVKYDGNTGYASKDYIR